MKPPTPDTTTLSVPVRTQPFYKSLFFHLAIAVIAGISVGPFFPDL